MELVLGFITIRHFDRSTYNTETFRKLSRNWATPFVFVHQDTKRQRVFGEKSQMSSKITNEIYRDKGSIRKSQDLENPSLFNVLREVLKR